MSELLVWREKLQEFYAKRSIYVDKTMQFILAVVSFYVVNRNIGLMKAVAAPLVTFGLAVICTFLPPVFTALTGAALVLLHMSRLSLGVMGVTALIFLVMFIFYCHFTPKKALILLITPIAFLLNIPYVVPVACALVMGPVAVVPIVFGTIIYYMIVCVKGSSAAIASAKGVTAEITLFVKTVFQNKSMWITIFAFVICVLVVYAIRRFSVDHAWKLAVAAGAIVNIIVIVTGDVAFDVHTSYGMLILGNLLAIVVGLILEFFLFSVDYSRTERLQFEDDEYYYYVKAVPKVSVAVPRKTVKRINERKNTGEIDSGEMRRRPQGRAEVKNNPRRNPSGSQQVKRRSVQPKTSRVHSNTDELLLAKSLRDELDIQNIVEKELKNK